MLFFPNTKINIGLHVISKRPDGYHNIETIFCPIELSDFLEFVPSPERSAGDIRFSLSGIPVEGSVDDNLCVKAYYLLHKDFQMPAIDAHLHKVVPPGSGLGGGSSDAAFMLKNLNKQCILGLDEDTLCDYASKLGSDCAFFIKNRPLFGFEKGNKFMEISRLPDKMHVVVINPGIHVSTVEAYAGVKPSRPAVSLMELIRLPIKDWKENIYNDFENSVFIAYPFIRDIKERLYGLGAVYASMSGSGSSVYGIFNEKNPDIKNHFPDLTCWTGKIIQIPA
jgi:4-diphosphocytidyl-2-C-methyl-D-erythritol kinase